MDRAPNAADNLTRLDSSGTTSGTGKKMGGYDRVNRTWLVRLTQMKR